MSDILYSGASANANGNGNPDPNANNNANANAQPVLQNRKQYPYTPGLNVTDIPTPNINDPSQRGKVLGLQKHIATLHSLLRLRHAMPIPSDFSNPATCLIVKGSANKARTVKSVEPLPHEEWPGKHSVGKFSARPELDIIDEDDDSKMMNYRASCTIVMSVISVLV